MLSYLITYLCLTTDPIYNQACNQALNAATIQLHYKQDLDLMQANFQHDVETEILKRSRREIWIATLGIYQIYTKSTLVFNMPAKPFADSVSGSISQTGGSSSINLTWSF